MICFYVLETLLHFTQMISRLENIEYKGYSIQIKQDQKEETTGDVYWTFYWGKNGQPLEPAKRRFTGYDDAFEEAEKFIDRKIISDA